LNSIASAFICFCAGVFFFRLVEREPSTADAYSGSAVVTSSRRLATSARPSQSRFSSAPGAS